MAKDELIAILQKIEGNPQISVGIDRAWGKESIAVTGITVLHSHDGHRVEPNACILEFDCENKQKLSEEQIAEMHRDYLIRRYGPLSICGIDERFWAVNGYWLDKWNREKIELLENKIKSLSMEKDKV
jgi:hypothetical protein